MKLTNISLEVVKKCIGMSSGFYMVHTSHQNVYGAVGKARQGNPGENRSVNSLNFPWNSMEISIEFHGIFHGIP
jgi:hypothetical protein